MTIDYSSFIEQVRDANPIEDVVQSAEFGGVKLSGGARQKKGVDHDSLVVDVSYQNYHWYSKEGEKFWSGDVFAWVQREKGCDFMEALRTLADRAHLDMPKLKDEDRAHFAAVRVTQDAFDVAARIFAEWLWKDEQALAYVRGRGWTDETIREAGLGFSGRGTPQEYEQMKNALSATVDIHSPAAVALLGLRGGVAAWGAARNIDVSKWLDKDRIPSMLGWGDLFGLIYPCVERGKTTYFVRRHIKLNEAGMMVSSDEPKSYNLPKELIARRVYHNRVWSRHTDRHIWIEGPACAVTFLQWELQRRALLKQYRDEKKDAPVWLEAMPEMSATSILGKEWHGLADVIGDEAKAEDGHEACFIGLDNDKAGLASIKGMKGEEYGIAEKIGALTRVLEFPEKDANDWLKWMVKSGLGIEEQLELVNQQLGNAKPIAIHAARWMGTLRNEDQLKNASERVARILNSMSPADIQFYTKDLLKALSPLTGDDGEKKYGTKRDLDQWLGKVKKEDKGKKKEEDAIYTFGGRIGKWLLEYCYDPFTQKAHWAYKDDKGEVGEKDEVMIDGLKYAPMDPIGNKMISDGAALFPSGLARKKDGSIDRRSTRELTIAMANEFRRDYLFSDHKWAALASYWVLGTWIYDNFHELVYLRMVGDAGAGKSALLNLLGGVSYRAIKMSGADSESTFFRITDEYRGTMMFEEADLAENTGPENPIVKYVNLGAFDGNYIYRMEEFIKPDGTKGWRPTPYKCYCPKMFAMRGDFMDNAVATRSITIELTSAETQAMKDHGTPWRMTDEMRARLLHIRNLCLTWRMFEWSTEERELGWDLVDTEIPMRFNQVTIPLKSLAKNIDGTKDDEFLNQMEVILREHYQQLIGDAAISWEARTAEAMWKIYTLSDLQERIEIRADGALLFKVGDVTAIVNNIADEMNEEGSDLRDKKSEFKFIKKDDGSEEQVEIKKHKKDFEKGAQAIGRILRKTFQLEFANRNGNKGYRAIWDEKKMRSVAKKYGCLPAEETIEGARMALEARKAGMDAARNVLKKVKPEQERLTTVLGSAMVKNEAGEWVPAGNGE